VRRLLIRDDLLTLKFHTVPPTAFSVGPARVNHALLVAGLGRTLLPNPAGARGARLGALVSEPCL
jgi:hypothetical protein